MFHKTQNHDICIHKKGISIFQTKVPLGYTAVTQTYLIYEYIIVTEEDQGTACIERGEKRRMNLPFSFYNL